MTYINLLTILTMAIIIIIINKTIMEQRFYWGTNQ